MVASRPNASVFEAEPIPFRIVRLIFGQVQEGRCQRGCAAPVFQCGIGGPLFVIFHGGYAVTEGLVDIFRDEEFAEAMDVSAEAKSFSQSIIGLFEKENLSFLDGIWEPDDLGWIVERLASDDDRFLDFFDIDSCVCRERLQLEHGNFL